MRTDDGAFSAALCVLFVALLSACSSVDSPDPAPTNGGTGGAASAIGGAGGAGVAQGPGGAGPGGAGAGASVGGASVGGASVGGASVGGASVGGASVGGASAGGSGGAAGGAGAAPIDHDAVRVIVVLGSSTAAGTGPLDPANAWVERYRAYLKSTFPKFQLTNLAVGGYSTYDIQPSDFKAPAGAAKPNPEHNITKALSLKPNAILINMPTNDTENGYSAAIQHENFQRVTALAQKSKVPCWVTTSQPRNFNGEAAATVQAKHLVLMAVRDDIEAMYGDHALDFWTQFANTDGSIKAIYAKADGTHMNDAAHALLVKEVILAMIPEAILAKLP